MSSVALLFTALTCQGADIVYTGEGSGDLWSTAANWNGGTFPNDSDTGAAFKTDGTNVLIQSGIDAVCKGFILGMYGDTNSATISGGSLNCTWLDIGRGNANGGNGTLTITDGQITIANDLNIPKQLGETITYGQLNLHGGTISVPALHIGDRTITGAGGGNGSIFIDGGTLILEGNQTALIEGYISAGYITTEGAGLFNINFDPNTGGETGQTTVTADGVFSGYADNPYPSDELLICTSINSLTWSTARGAENYRVYFGTTNTPPLIATVDGSTGNYSMPALTHETTYHWRVDSVQGDIVNTGVLWSFTTRSEEACSTITPPITDYCAMLSQEIQGKKHGFLAGNKTYYIGGWMPVWRADSRDDETIGFTHPFHNDLRSRGHGMVDHPETGYGHDFTGWEFHKATKVAYGTVIINGTRYENPAPTAMYWRPDRMICEYLVAGVTIREDKFIALNDTACSIITSDAPVTLEFAGQSFYRDGKTVSTTATCTFDSVNNAVHVVEGGVNLVEAQRDEVFEGVMMYDGMSTILSASKPLENYTNTTGNTGQQFYSFTVPCDANGLSLVWAMNDDGATAIADAQAVLADSSAELDAKTDYMNDLLNNQVPYFRCSDDEIVQVYYYLWSIYMMYYIDLGADNNERYAHTQTAVNNFLGMHRYDASFQIPVSSWLADKAYYANGNALLWKSMLPHANLETGQIPADNLGQTWHSGKWNGVTAHVPGAWKIYQHSGDIDFLDEIYDFYRTLMWNEIPGIWGGEYKAADCLGEMALELGYPQSEADHWQDVVNIDQFDNWLNNMWEKSGFEHYFGAGSAASSLGWSTFAYLGMEDFPKDWARDMVETWALDSANGFYAQGQMSTVAAQTWHLHPNKNFFITPGSYYFALIGMYQSGVYDHANSLTLAQLKNYNFNPDWGVPCAPEAMRDTYEFHGDQYSNINAGIILLMLEGICGLSYSVVDDSFTVADNMPKEWTFMETYVPITKDGLGYWTRVVINRNEVDSVVSKDIQVENNRLLNLNIEPWMEGKSLLRAPGNYSSDSEIALEHIDYTFENAETMHLSIQLTDPDQVEMLSDSFSLTADSPQNPGGMLIQFGLGTPDPDTTVVLERAINLADGFDEIYRFETNSGIETLIAPEIESNVVPHFFSISDEMMPEGKAFYRVRTLVP